MINATERILLSSYSHIRHWVEDLPKKGYLSFSLDDVKAQFPHMMDKSVLNAIYRLSRSGKALSVWRGYYAIVLPEYGLDGSVPPVEYLDHLMDHLNANYYIALLSAASLQGASHQSPQVFQVMVDRKMRRKQIADSRLEFVYKNVMPPKGIEQKTVKSGFINVSAPLLTALDLVTYSSRSGGISHVATVLEELADSIDPHTLDQELLLHEPRASVQRLGYLLDSVLGKVELADYLYDESMRAGLRFRSVDLVAGWQGQEKGVNKKWKVSVNYDVEVDK